jgi:hypothetical protein
VVEHGGQSISLPADSVILALGYEADNRLETKLRKQGHGVEAIGDCGGPGNIKDAIHQGFKIIVDGVEGFVDRSCCR